MQTLNILGVELTAKFGFSSHIKRLTIKARQSFYALRILRSHGLSGDRLFDVVRATTVAYTQIPTGIAGHKYNIIIKLEVG